MCVVVQTKSMEKFTASRLLDLSFASESTRRLDSLDLTLRRHSDACTDLRNKERNRLAWSRFLASDVSIRHFPN